MDEKDWLLLKTLYQEKNITKAAELLYISQPALTYRIQQLEKTFNTNIAIRGKKGIEFTSQGEILVNYAEKMLLELQKAKESIQNMNHTVEGTLRLGVSGNFMRYRLPVLLKQFVELHPLVEIHVKSGWSSEALNYVQKEEVHAGIVRGDHHWPEQSILLSTEPFCLASKNPIQLDELPQLPRINYKITDYHLRHVIEKWWYEKFAQPPFITMEVDSVDSCVELIKNGLGYAFVPGISIRNQDDLFTMNLYTKENEPIIRKTKLIYRNTSLELAVVQAFVEFMRSHCNDNN